MKDKDVTPMQLGIIIVIMFLIAFVIPLLASCKKEETKPQQQVKTHTLNYTAIGASYRLVQVNGVSVIPPIQVKSGDKVYVKFAEQPTTPTAYDMFVNITLDGQIIGGCNSCDQYSNTFNI